MTATPQQRQALTDAIAMLDSEEHRYVERFYPCPAGCEFTHDQTPRRVAGPDVCPHGCFYGTLEDEDAHHIDDFIATLRELAAELAPNHQP